MVIWHRKSRRKLTGGLRKESGKKKKRERGRDNIPVTINKRKIKKIRVRGGSSKLVLLSDSFANVLFVENNISKIKKLKILNVIENPANPHLVRQNIITKGCIIETEMGKARITSRPGQSGVLNAVLIEPKKQEDKK